MVWPTTAVKALWGSLWASISPWQAGAESCCFSPSSRKNPFLPRALNPSLLRSSKSNLDWSESPSVLQGRAFQKHKVQVMVNTSSGGSALAHALFPLCYWRTGAAACSPSRDSRLKPAAFVHVFETGTQIRTIPRKTGKHLGLVISFAQSFAGWGPAPASSAGPHAGKTAR